jgi:hypothetical protein
VDRQRLTDLAKTSAATDAEATRRVGPAPTLKPAPTRKTVAKRVPTWKPPKRQRAPTRREVPPKATVLTVPEERERLRRACPQCEPGGGGPVCCKHTAGWTYVCRCGRACKCPYCHQPLPTSGSGRRCASTPPSASFRHRVHLRSSSPSVAAALLLLTPLLRVRRFEPRRSPLER